MDDNKVVRGGASTIRDLLVGFQKCFVIPPFQRNYSWETDQCKELYEDMVASAISKQPHYLGNIVSYSGVKTSSSYQERVLVDGQQRITTVLLLICAIKDVIDDKEQKENLLNNYLINNSAKERRVRLKQASGDIIVFESILMNKIEELTQEQKTNKLLSNYYLFVSLLKNEKRVDILKDLLEAIVETEIIDISLIDSKNLNAVQTVFEKINSTGKKLTSGDLIRNYLLFAKSSEEQQKLYDEYWIHIEEKISDITKFSKNYYILDSLEYFDEDDIYYTFKEYYTTKNISHEEILKGMKTTSEYYNMVENNNISNEILKQNIKYLKKLQYDDLLPLLTYMYQETFSNGKKTEELEKILDLLVDFMFRYRIVKPYTGGGPIKEITLNLLSKLKNKEINLCYDHILYELSNSYKSNQRFPDDDEFKASLISGDKDKYKRELLLRLEDKETKNIKVDVDSDLTLEHLMPQTKSKWWIKNMGGAEKYQNAIEKYLNSIGNLAILSRGYNSINSNDPWNEKLNQLSTAQFKITLEVSKNKQWKQEEIEKRNKSLVKRICKYTISPLPRDRDIQTVSLNDTDIFDFNAGTYDLFDKTFPSSGISIYMFEIDNIKVKVSSWREFFNKLCYEMIKYDANMFENLVMQNLIHKNKSSYNKKEKDPIITKDKKLLQYANIVEGTKYYTEACLSQARTIVYSRALIENMNYDKPIILHLE